MQLILRSLHFKLIMSAMLIIAFMMSFSVYVLYMGHAEEQSQKVSTRMQENLSRLLSAGHPASHGFKNFDKTRQDISDPSWTP